MRASPAKSLAWSVGLAVGTVAACDNGTTIIADNCFVSLAAITPSLNPITTGDTLTLHVVFTPTTCLPADTAANQLRWASSDTLVIRVDSLKGFVTAGQPGLANIVLTTALTHTFLTQASARVTP